MLSRRHILGGALDATMLPTLPALAQSSGALSARQVFQQIKQASLQPWDPNGTDDRIIYGERDTPITGIATCFFASLDVLRKARAAGLNYIIPHEASFYERYDDLAESALRDEDPVLRSKTSFLTTHGMVIQRMHGHAHARPGDAITIGQIRQLGWEAQRVEDLGGRPLVRLPPTPAMEVGRIIKERTGRRTLRMFGDPARLISTISISAGMPGENFQIQQLESGADAVLLGEVREPEVLGYAQDLASSRPVTVFLGGHTNEDAGMGVVVEWLKTVFPQLPVQWLPVIDPYTNPA